MSFIGAVELKVLITLIALDLCIASYIKNHFAEFIDEIDSTFYQFERMSFQFSYLFPSSNLFRLSKCTSGYFKF